MTEEPQEPETDAPGREPTSLEDGRSTEPGEGPLDEPREPQPPHGVADR